MRRRRVGGSCRAQPPRDAAVAGVSEPRVVQNPRLMRVSYGVAAKVLVPLWCYTISGALHPFRAGAMLPKRCSAL